MFIAISDFWNNIAGGLDQIGVFFNNIDWVATSTGIKNWILSGAGLGVLGLFLKFGVPYFKDKKQLTILGKLIERVAASELEQQTVGNVLTDYISLQSEVNVTSKTLTQEQKEKFTLLATNLKEMQNERMQSIGEEIETMVEDNVITAEEGVELLKNVPIIEEALGTKLSDIV